LFAIDNASLRRRLRGFIGRCLAARLSGLRLTEGGTKNCSLKQNEAAGDGFYVFCAMPLAGLLR